MSWRFLWQSYHVVAWETASVIVFNRVHWADWGHDWGRMEKNLQYIKETGGTIGIIRYYNTTVWFKNTLQSRDFARYSPQDLVGLVFSSVATLHRGGHGGLPNQSVAGNSWKFWYHGRDFTAFLVCSNIKAYTFENTNFRWEIKSNYLTMADYQIVIGWSLHHKKD